jgi:3-oxoacyl-[acyl-carrier protein] reductase
LAHLVKGGRIITIGSYVADRVPTPILSVYAATKSALAAFTNALALGPKEVTVNLVPLGSIDTEMFPANGPHAETAKQFTALDRYGAPEDIANAAAVLGVHEGSIHSLARR